MKKKELYRWYIGGIIYLLIDLFALLIRLVFNNLPWGIKRFTYAGWTYGLPQSLHYYFVPLFLGIYSYIYEFIFGCLIGRLLYLLGGKFINKKILFIFFLIFLLIYLILMTILNNIYQKYY